MVFAAEGWEAEGDTSGAAAGRDHAPCATTAEQVESPWTIRDGERCRYLWYRHAARILSWCDRKQFPDNVIRILRTYIFSTQASKNEETREDGKGGVPTGAVAHSWDCGANHHDQGKISK